MKHKYRSFLIVIFLLFLTINAIPSVLGKTRKSYLTGFILDCELKNRGFANAIDGELSLEATAYALEILDKYSINPQEVETLQTNLENRVKKMFDDDAVELYNLYFLMKSINILEHSIDSALSNRIYKFLNDTEQITGGFSFSNTSNSANIASTYYVIQLYSLINETIENISLHKSWVLSCNNTDGGYGGDPSSVSTYINTCFAVFILDDERFGDIYDLADFNNTLIYLQSFYVGNSADLDNYGGYLPDGLAEYALLSSTYLCVKAIALMDYSQLNAENTIDWTLSRQNYKDGGFAENTDGYQEIDSSVISCFYAFETLRIFNSLSKLNVEIWMVEFNYWILTIVLGSIGFGIALIVFLWKRRRI